MPEQSTKESLTLFAARLQADRVTSSGRIDLVVGIVLIVLSFADPVLAPERLALAVAYTVLALPRFRQRYRIVVMWAWVMSIAAHSVFDASGIEEQIAWLAVSNFYSLWFAVALSSLWSDPSPRAARQEVESLEHSEALAALLAALAHEGEVRA